MKTLLLVESERGRQHFLWQAEELLPEDEAVVEVADTVSLERSTLIVPLDPSAEVLAAEPPKLFPGGVTALVSYVRVRLSRMRAIEYELEGTRVVGTREINLAPARVGRTRRPRAVV